MTQIELNVFCYIQLFVEYNKYKYFVYILRYIIYIKESLKGNYKTINAKTIE